jgi:hypothetical protein
MITMEPDELNKSIHVSAYKISLTKQLEENARRLMEHYRKLQEAQEKRNENLKQETNSFVCDWQ